MKNLIVLLVFIALACTSFAQQNVQKLPPTQIDYLKKAKKQKTWAWILTAAGTAGLMITLAADAGQATTETIGSIFGEEPEYESYSVPYLLSAASIAGGVTLFILAGKNKRRAKEAASIFLNMENVPILARATLIRNQRIPAIGFKINL